MAEKDDSRLEKEESRLELELASDLGRNGRISVTSWPNKGLVGWIMAEQRSRSWKKLDLGRRRMDLGCSMAEQGRKEPNKVEFSQGLAEQTQTWPKFQDLMNFSEEQ